MKKATIIIKIGAIGGTAGAATTGLVLEIYRSVNAHVKTLSEKLLEDGKDLMMDRTDESRIIWEILSYFHRKAKSRSLVRRYINSRVSKDIRSFVSSSDKRIKRYCSKILSTPLSESTSNLETLAVNWCTRQSNLLSDEVVSQIIEKALKEIKKIKNNENTSNLKKSRRAKR